MVKSKIDSNINYTEYKQIDPDDKNYESSMYETILLGVNVIIALGKPKHTFLSKNIEYFPIYLIKDNKVELQIGIYEALASEINDMLDDDGDIDLNKFNPPLLFAYIVKNPSLMGDVNIEKLKYNIEEDSDEEVNSETEYSDKESDEEQVEETKSKGLNKIKEQTKEDAILEIEEYIENETDIWVRKFMKSNNYDIIDNEGKGDCLFSTIRDGLSRAGISRSVNDLREILSSYADESIFENYKILYSTTKQEYDIVYLKLKNVVDEHKKLKVDLEVNKDRTKQVEIVKRAKVVSEEYKKIKIEYEIVKSQLQEFKFIKDIKTLNDFKRVLTSCDFWGDVWAISVLENALNIKLILLSEEYYFSGDINNVLQCGLTDNDKIKEPNYYIICSYTGNHYKLITYKSRGAMTFSELPFYIKQLVVDKCMEGSGGPFYLIHEFRKLKGIDDGANEGEELNLEVEELNPEEVIEIKDTELKRGRMEEVSVEESIQKLDLWNEDTVFQFYERSSSKPLPGKGNGEKIGGEGLKTYSSLSNIMDWRRKLDDNWSSLFTLDNYRWKSVQHYYQASKFKNKHPEFYIIFSLDSNSDISKSVELAEAAGSKNGKHETTLLRPKNINIDPSFYSTNKYKEERKSALIAKFTQNEDMKQLLINTGLAKLMIFIPRKPALVDELLMEVRYDIVRSNR
jgi:hypothetical protein